LAYLSACFHNNDKLKKKKGDKVKVVWNWKENIKDIMAYFKGGSGKKIAYSRTELILVEQLSSHLQKDLGLEAEHTEEKDYSKFL
jgi:hypothetical protein